MADNFDVDPWAPDGGDGDRLGGGGGGGGGDGRGGGGGGGGSGPPPPVPRDVRIRLTGLGGYNVSWTDAPASFNTGGLSLYWAVTYASADLIGPQSNFVLNPLDPLNGGGWPGYVLNRSRRVATVNSSFSGRRISVSVFDPFLGDGWVMVVGYSSMGGAASISTPVFLNLANTQYQVPDNVTAGSVVVSKERTPYDVVKLAFAYTIPADNTKDYGGMHVHMLGYDGDAVRPREIGSEATWDHSTGNQYITYRLPQEAGQGTGTATFANGSGGVVRVSGTNFAAGWVGRKFIVDESSTVSKVYQVSAFTDINNLTITPVFAETGGTYTFTTLNNVTFYLVSIGTSGARRPDYASSFSVAI